MAPDNKHLRLRLVPLAMSSLVPTSLSDHILIMTILGVDGNNMDQKNIQSQQQLSHLMKYILCVVHPYPLQSCHPYRTRHCKYIFLHTLDSKSNFTPRHKHGCIVLDFMEILHNIDSPNHTISDHRIHLWEEMEVAVGRECGIDVHFCKRPARQNQVQVST